VNLALIACLALLGAPAEPEQGRLMPAVEGTFPAWRESRPYASTLAELATCAGKGSDGSTAGVSASPQVVYGALSPDVPVPLEIERLIRRYFQSVRPELEYVEPPEPEEDPQGALRDPGL